MSRLRWDVQRSAIEILSLSAKDGTSFFTVIVDCFDSEVVFVRPAELSPLTGELSWRFEGVIDLAIEAFRHLESGFREQRKPVEVGEALSRVLMYASALVAVTEVECRRLAVARMST